MRRNWRLAETLFGIKPEERELFAALLNGVETPKTRSLKRRIFAHCEKRRKELEQKWGRVNA